MRCEGLPPESHYCPRRNLRYSRSCRVGGVHAATLHPAYRLVRPRAPGVVGDETSALAAQVVADDDAHVLELLPLRRVYAAGLVRGGGAERERLPAVEVPADLEVADLDFVDVRICAPGSRSAWRVQRVGR